jgi:hypothetical protein
MVEQWIQEGGPAMYFLLAVGGLALPGTLVALVVGMVSRRPNRTAILSLILIGVGLVLFGTGAAAWWRGHRLTEEAIATVTNPADAETLRRYGAAEAQAPLVAGLFFALFPLAAGVGMSGLGIVRLARFQAIPRS